MFSYYYDLIIPFGTLEREKKAVQNIRLDYSTTSATSSSPGSHEARHVSQVQRRVVDAGTAGYAPAPSTALPVFKVAIPACY